MSSPYSWCAPPTPDTLILPDGTAFHTDSTRSWYRAPWSIEGATATLGALLPGWADIILSVQLDAPTETPITANVVRSALRSLRFEQPVIATRLAFHPAPAGSPVPFGNGVLVYETPASEVEVNTWLDDVITDRADALDVVGGDTRDAVALVYRETSKALEAYRSSQLEVSCIPTQDGHSGGLVLRCGHVAFDAAGAFEVMDSLIRKIAEVLAAKDAARESLAWGEETQRLAPSAVDLTRIPWTPGSEARNSLVGRKYLARLENFAEGVSVSSRNEYQH